MAKKRRKKGYVTCTVHGEQKGGIACTHLLNNSRNLGIYGSTHLLEAWCYECDQAFAKVGADWAKRDEIARFGCICRPCFEFMVRRNRLHSITRSTFTPL